MDLFSQNITTAPDVDLGDLSDRNIFFNLCNYFIANYPSMGNPDAFAKQIIKYLDGLELDSYFHKFPKYYFGITKVYDDDSCISCCLILTRQNYRYTFRLTDFGFVKHFNTNVSNDFEFNYTNFLHIEENHLIDKVNAFFETLKINMS